MKLFKLILGLLSVAGIIYTVVLLNIYVMHENTAEFLKASLAATLAIALGCSVLLTLSAMED